MIELRAARILVGRLTAYLTGWLAAYLSGWLTACRTACLTGLLLPGTGFGEPVCRLEPADRIVAIGDLHGDLDATRAALRLGGVMDRHERWIGGETVLVQLGDQLDRGDGEFAILDLLEDLGHQARSAGGAVHILNGNHEYMNVEGDLRYVTPQGMRQACDLLTGSQAVTRPCLPESARREVFRPGSPLARRLSRRCVALVVGPNLFVHGGILPHHLTRGLDGLNADQHRWLAGTGPRPDWMDRPDNPVWTRAFSEDENPDCDRLASVLDALDIDRMVVAHTVQETLNPACEGRVWRIDIGLSSAYGGPVQVLEITPEGERVLEQPEP